MKRHSNIQVVVRLRPFQGASCIREIGQDYIKVENGSNPFVFDQVFAPSSTQEQIFETSGKQIVDGVLEGYNGCVLAYGQTGSGKSHTMMGPPELPPGTQHEHRGLIPRMLEYLFARKTNEHKVKVGFMEIYNEKVFDLLNPESEMSDLKIHEQQGGGGFYVKGLKENEVQTVAEVVNAMQIGDKNRKTASTLMNARSSRSHSVFLVDVESPRLKAKLVLVDLAGSEKVAKTGARGLLLEEAANINRSLSALGMVVNALSSGQAQHVPFRDSKLTRILQDSLSGNSRTCLIVQCSPMETHISETVSSLRFGARAKDVKTMPKPNLVMPLNWKEISLQTQLELNQMLKSQNQWLQSIFNKDKRRLELQKRQIKFLDEQLRQLETQLEMPLSDNSASIGRNITEAASTRTAGTSRSIGALGGSGS